MSPKRSTDDDLDSKAGKQAAPRSEGRLAAKAKNNLVALGSAAVFTVYGAGFMRTKAAAARFENDTDDRRPPLPGPRTGPVRPSDAATPSPSTTAQAQAPSAIETKTHAPEAGPAPTVAVMPAAAAGTHAESAKAPAAAPAATPAQMPVATAPASAPVVQALVAPAAPTPSPAPAHDSSNNSNGSSNNSNATATAAADSAAQTEKKGLKDGTFTGWGTSRHGDIQATVMIKSGKIFFAGISECMTQYSCSWINALPPQVVARQSADVDYVSGATQSTIAFYRAVLEAMSKAK